ncbi:MAG: hypothetical protein Ct9H300mP2_2830 [Candidatus Neomarinimicrobiota bacterium]|nr:MAG: hypothetical protein Ct9H300mP2_2830 [Candidatus Neomarinimicrobiota bacterium]
MALKGAGMNPVDFLWNQHKEKLLNCNGLLLLVDFLMKIDPGRGDCFFRSYYVFSKKRSIKRKTDIRGLQWGPNPSRSGMVPGLIDGKIGIALTDNKRVKNGRVVGTGYYNDWAYLKMSVKPEQTALPAT